MAAPSAPQVEAIHHFAYKCRNAEETRHFYEDILQMPLVMVVEENDLKTSTGDTLSFTHFFFEMNDGNYVAFFDFGDDTAVVPDPNTPRFANHLAFKVNGEEEMLKGKERLESFGIAVDGPLQHEFVRSVYFWDPNGIRLEYTYTAADAGEMQHYRDGAKKGLADWIAKVEKKKAQKAQA